MSDNSLTERKIMEALDWTYDKALAGGMGIDSAQELAESYLKEKGSLEDKINSLIRWQNTKSATSGFLTGIGGLATMPVAVPANFASVIVKILYYPYMILKKIKIIHLFSCIIFIMI